MYVFTCFYKSEKNVSYLQINVFNIRHMASPLRHRLTRIRSPNHMVTDAGRRCLL